MSLIFFVRGCRVARPRGFGSRCGEVCASTSPTPPPAAPTDFYESSYSVQDSTVARYRARQRCWATDINGSAFSSDSGQFGGDAESLSVSASETSLLSRLANESTKSAQPRHSPSRRYDTPLASDARNGRKHTYNLRHRQTKSNTG